MYSEEQDLCKFWETRAFRAVFRNRNDNPVPSTSPVRMTRPFEEAYRSKSHAGHAQGQRRKFVKRVNLNAMYDATSTEKGKIDELIEMVFSKNDLDDVVWVKVGRILVEMQIDSRVRSNISNDSTWGNCVQIRSTSFFLLDCP